MNQIKSKKRVANHGEVFTSERVMNAIFDLVKQERANRGALISLTSNLNFKLLITEVEVVV